MDALDDPRVELAVMVKPFRSGGTSVAEKFLGKKIQFGPIGNVGWYLGSDDAVKKMLRTRGQAAVRRSPAPQGSDQHG